MKTTVVGFVLGAGMMLVGCSKDDDTDDDDGPMMRPDVGGKCAPAINWEVWVARQGANDIKIVNGPQFSLDATVDLSSSGLTAPHNITFTPNEEWALVAMLGNDTMMNKDGGVLVLNTETRKVVGAVNLKAKTHHVGITPDGKQAWAVNVNNDTIDVLDLSGLNAATPTVAWSVSDDRITVGGTGGALVAKFNSAGTKAFVTNKGVIDMKSSLSVFDVATRTKDGADYVTGQVTTEMSITKDDKILYLTNQGDNNVEKIDLTATDRAAAVSVFASNIVGSHAVVLGKGEIAITGRGEGKLYFADVMGEPLKTLDVPATMGNSQPDIFAFSPNCDYGYLSEKTDGKLHQVKMKELEITAEIDFMGGVPHGVAVKTAPSDM